MLPCYWALLTLLLSCGSFGTEGKLFQRISRPQQENKETKRWLPLPDDLTTPALAAQKDSKHTKHLTLANRKLTKQPRNGDLVPWKKYKQDGILKRRHGFSQVGVHPQILNLQLRMLTAKFTFQRSIYICALWSCVLVLICSYSVVTRVSCKCSMQSPIK